METIALRSYRLEFAKRAEWRREDERRVLDQLKDQDEKEKKRERDAENDHDALIDAVVAVLATNMELAQFTVELDSYDAATVEALMQNEAQLKEVRAELKALLDKAYVLPDGRRVFRTEDGTRVFDEHGKEVMDIDPNTIEEWRPYWERYEGPFKQEFALTEERDDILEFQKLSDEVRAEVGHAEEHGGMTEVRLEELRKKLADEAPDAVERHMRKGDKPALDTLDNEPQTLPVRPAPKLDMPAL